jgi:hypothetical protein
MGSESILFNPVIQFAIIFGASLLASLLLYGILKSTGVFKSKGMQLGGAAAGFVIIVIVASWIFGDIDSRRHQDEIRKKQEEIREKDDTIDALKRGELPGIEHPPGFKVGVSYLNGIAYAYPEDWPLAPYRIVAHYLAPVSDEPSKSDSFRANISITVSPIEPALSDKLDEAEVTEKDVLEFNAAGVVATFKGYNEENSVFIVDNRQGLKTTLEYEDLTTGITLSVEQVTVIDRKANRFFAFTLTGIPGQTEEARDTFYSLLHSVKFLDY